MGDTREEIREQLRLNFEAIKKNLIEDTKRLRSAQGDLAYPASRRIPGTEEEEAIKARCRMLQENIRYRIARLIQLGKKQW